LKESQHWRLRYAVLHCRRYQQAQIETFMLIKFQTPAYATITMFGDVAITLIKLMGHSGRVPGALLAADIPSALACLEAAVSEYPDLPLDPTTTNAAPAGDAGQHVSLAHRAMPLIALLKAAGADGETVMWERV